MTDLDTSALLARLDPLADEAEQPPILAFDADGTIWQGDVTADLFSFIMTERPYRAEAMPHLAALARNHGLEPAGEPHEQVGRLVIAYSTGAIPEEPAVEAVLLGFAGHLEGDFVGFVEEAIRRAGLADRLFAEVAPLFDWARSRGLPTVVVSASPRIVVERALAALGIEVTAVLGAEARIGGGHVLSELDRPVLVGPAKVTALRGYTDQPVLAAFGDDVRDLELLATSRQPVAVRPTDALEARIDELADAVRLTQADRD